MAVSFYAFGAGDEQGQHNGEIATQIVGSFASLAKPITAASYFCGLIFLSIAVYRFIKKKSKAISWALLVLALALLLFLPGFLNVSGNEPPCWFEGTCNPNSELFNGRP